VLFLFPLTVKQQASFPVKVPVASSRLALGFHMVECGAKISRKFPHNRCRVSRVTVVCHAILIVKNGYHFEDRSTYCRKIEICCLFRAFLRTITDCPKIFQLTFAGCSTESSFCFSPCSTTVYFREAPIVCSFCRHATLLPTKERCVTTQGG